MLDEESEVELEGADELELEVLFDPSTSSISFSTSSMMVSSKDSSEAIVKNPPCVVLTEAKRVAKSKAIANFI